MAVVGGGGGQPAPPKKGQWAQTMLPNTAKVPSPPPFRTTQYPPFFNRNLRNIICVVIQPVQILLHRYSCLDT